MRDPRDRELCEALAQATRLRIAPFLTSEIRLFFLLERHFGVAHRERYARLAPAAAPAAHELSVLWLDDVVEEETQASEQGWAPLGAGEELIDQDSFAHLYQRFEQARGDAGRVRPTNAPAGSTPGCRLVEGAASLASLEAGLAEARDRDAVVMHALALAVRHAPAAALFAVRGTLQGLAGSGEVACGSLRDVLVAPEAGSLVTRAIDRREPVRGPPGSDGVDVRLARLLRGFDPVELAYFPVQVAGRVVNLLYTDNGREPLPATSWTALQDVCERTGRSYERIIRERRRRLC